MTYTLVVSFEAEEALMVGYDWYNSQHSGLGAVFLDHVERAFAFIQSNPLFYSFRRVNIRGYHVHKFPYVIFYVVDDDVIRVISIMHSRQKPKVGM